MPQGFSKVSSSPLYGKSKETTCVPSLELLALRIMDVVLKYRGRMIRKADLQLVRALIRENRTASRRELSRKLCEAWDWRQANGALCDMVCRGAMLALDRAGYIALPPIKWRPLNPLAARPKPEWFELDRTPIGRSLKDVGPLEFRLVRRTAEEPLFNGLIEHYHYLRYSQPVGEHLKYMVLAGNRPVACLAWSSAPRHLGPRDHFIGWSGEARRRNIQYIAYNTRFVILPWAQPIAHLASHILGQMAKRISRDWERTYAHPIYLLETFVDPERFRGTCYRAANWIVVGQTTGRGKDSRSWKPNRSIKQILVLPVHRQFRQLLSQGGE